MTTSASVQQLLLRSTIFLILSTGATLTFSTPVQSVSRTGALNGSNVTLKCYLYIKMNQNVLQIANVTSSAGENMILHSVGLPVMSSANASTAKVVGRARGLTVETSGGDSGSSREQVFETIEYSDGVYNGSLAIHGQISFPPVSGDEIAIVGGTGDFRRVTGYAFPALASSLTANPIILGWDIHLFFPMH